MTKEAQDNSDFYDMHSEYKVLERWNYDKDSQMFTGKQATQEVYSLLEFKLHTGKKH